MKLLSSIQVKPISYTENTYSFEEGLEYSIRLYDGGGYTLHDCDGFQLDESTDDFHCYHIEFTDQILNSLGLL